MKTWNDVFDVQYRTVRSGRLGKTVSGWFIVDRRTNTCHAKRYNNETIAKDIAKNKFKRIIKEVDSLFVGTDGENKET